MNILSSCTHPNPHVVPKPYGMLSSLEHKTKTTLAECASCPFPHLYCEKKQLAHSVKAALRSITTQSIQETMMYNMFKATSDRMNFLYFHIFMVLFQFFRLENPGFILHKTQMRRENEFLLLMLTTHRESSVMDSPVSKIGSSVWSPSGSSESQT